MSLSPSLSEPSLRTALLYFERAALAVSERALPTVLERDITPAAATESPSLAVFISLAPCSMRTSLVDGWGTPSPSPLPLLLLLGLVPLP